MYFLIKLSNFHFDLRVYASRYPIPGIWKKTTNISAYGSWVSGMSLQSTPFASKCVKLHAPSSPRRTSPQAPSAMAQI
jgi:hypothetical protein